MYHNNTEVLKSPWQPAPSASGWGCGGQGFGGRGWGGRGCWPGWGWGWGWGRGWGRGLARWGRCFCRARPGPPAAWPPASPSAAGSVWSSPPEDTHTHTHTHTRDRYRGETNIVTAAVFVEEKWQHAVNFMQFGALYRKVSVSRAAKHSSHFRLKASAN